MTTTDIAERVCARTECGQPIPPRKPGSGRSSDYCGNPCRQKAYRERKTPSTPAHTQHTAHVERAAGNVLDLFDALEQLMPDGQLARWRETASILSTDAALLLSTERRLTELLKAAGGVYRLLFTLTPEKPQAFTASDKPKYTSTAIEFPSQTDVFQACAELAAETPASAPAAPTVARMSLAGYPLTGEQIAIIDAATTGDNLVIEAGAGTGKTTGLKEVAAALGGRGLYIAFNRAVADEAKRAFPGNVYCATAHKLAYDAVIAGSANGRAYKRRMDAGRVPIRETITILGVSAVQASKEVYLGANTVARLVMETVERYCRTADRTPTEYHVPRMNGIDDATHKALRKVIAPYAVKAWADICDPNGKLRFVPDHFLKMWQLGGPVLDYDYILFDEAQDADPLIASVVQSQACQLIAVGDRCQAIYAWRGAVDAIADWPAKHRLQLSASWRFGTAVAAEANKWLTVLGSNLRISGTETVTSTVAKLDRPDAILCRTNGEALRQAMLGTAAGRRVGLVGGGQTMSKLAYAALDLMRGKRTDHAELCAFNSWAEVQDYVQQEKDGGDLATFVRMIDSYGADEIIAVCGRLVDEKYADLIISTAHKAKGREWDRVKIADDFKEPKPLENGEPGPIPRDMAMLAYVAVTRAKLQLDRGSLSWIDSRI